MAVSEKEKIAFEFHIKNELTKAEKLYREILEENSQNAEILNLLGILKFTQKKFKSAQKYVKQALSIKKDSYYYETLARIFIEAKNYKKACRTLEDAEQNVNCTYEIYFLEGLAYKNSFKLEKAETAYKKALEFVPNSEDVLFNLASIYLLLNKPEEAIKHFKKCLEISPNRQETLYFLGIAYFRMKNYEEGLSYFENRLCRQTAIRTQEITYPQTMSKAKLWEGEDINGKTFYTYYEAGFGDMLMFARYIPELQKRCKKLIIKPQQELAQLFKDNFQGIEVMEYFCDPKDMDFDVHIPFLSVPYVLGNKTKDMFISKDRYLSATEDKIKFYKEKFFNNDQFKIAIKWQGNTYYDTDRVINVEAFAPLFELPNTKIYSAQTFEGAEEYEKLASKYDITDLSQSFKDFSYTAGAVANLDLIICNDTSLAHLAGAMGKPCIVLLPYQYNWRWHMDLSKCDWYESVKIFRLEKNESWNKLMKRVCKTISPNSSF